MLILSNDVPSGGQYSISPPIQYRPLTFMEILEYSNQVTGNAVKDYLRDIRWLIKLDRGVLQHSLYDLDYLIFMMKVHTVADAKEFQTDIKCDTCSEPQRLRFTLEDFSFKDLDEKEDMVHRVVISNYKYKVRIPTIEEFLKVLETYALYQKTDNVEVVKLISLFPEFETMPNDIEQAVLNASRSDISILYMLETKYLTSVNSVKRTCIKCNKPGGMAIGISSLIASMFLDVLLNNPVDESKVQFN